MESSPGPVLQIKVLIVKFIAVDTHATCTIAAHEVTSLNHETLDAAVKRRALVAYWLAQLAELTCT